jgi:hypothetical protein
MNRSKLKLTAIGVPCLTGWIFSFLAIEIFKDYAVGLFVWLPFVMGFITSLICGYNFSTKKRDFFKISALSLLLFCFGLLLFAWEGAICLIMALPIGLFFNLLGCLIGYAFITRKVGNSSATILILFISVPCFMAFENTHKKKEELRFIKTSIEINASPDVVWKNVIAFPQLNPPTEFVFKTGIAYPINATIDGKGVGAVRHCNFTTGSFVEPITIWNEPHLLQFSVKDQPEPMKELSFYDIHPSHLHGYWVSQKGQFKLIQLANGHTLLEGTTWYINKINPGFYWTLWSDYIVHKIHTRVLEHIKNQSEKTTENL